MSVRPANTRIGMSGIAATAVAMAVVCVIACATTFAQNKGQKGKGNRSKAASKAKADEELDPNGQPTTPLSAKFGATARYSIWYDSRGWHLRTTSPQARRFHGTIHVKDGTVASTISVGIERGKKKKEDAWKVGPARKQLTFDMKTAQLADGFDFRIDGDTAELEFDLSIDNRKPANRVFIGREGQHPKAVPFTLKAVPEKKERKTKKKPD